MGQREMVEQAERLFPGGSIGVLRVPESSRMIVREARGAHLYDADGREYIDYVLGSGPMILGHAHPAVVAAVQEAATRGSSYYIINEYALALADEIVRSVACAEKIRFMSGGSEATYLALRLARAYTGRAKVLKFEGAFHGFHDISMVSVSPKPKDYVDFPAGVPGSLGMSEAIQSEVLVAPYNDLETVTRIAEANRDDLAAIIVEPIQREIAPAPGFLEGLRELSTRLGAVLIFDEVVTAYRLTYGGAQDLFGVIPDLATLGKTIGGGYPLSAIVGRAEIMDLCDEKRPGGSVYLSSTLGGNPVSAAAGLATLRELAKPGTYDQLYAIGEMVRSGLEELLESLSIEGLVVGEGPMFHIHFGTTSITDYRSSAASDKEAGRRFFEGLLRRGIFVNTGKKAYISLAHTEQDVERTLVAAMEAMQDVRAAQTAV